MDAFNNKSKLFPYLSILAFLLLLFLLIQTHRLHKNLEAAQTQLSNLTTVSNNQNTRLSTLETNTSQFQNADTTLKNLKSLQANSVSLILIELQRDLLQGMNKSVLQNDLNSLSSLSNNLQSNQINTSIQNLKTTINNLPNINPNNSITQLNQLQQSLATLSFTTPSTATANTNNINISNWFQKMWLRFKNLIIVRTNNDIGTQLVSDAARFDAVRQLNLLIQEASWQILTSQDPSTTLTQLKISISAYTENNTAQATWLTQLNNLQSNANYYTNAQIQPILSIISTLQTQLSSLQ